MGTREVIPGSQLSEEAKVSTLKNSEYEGGSAKLTPEIKNGNREESVQSWTVLYLVDLPIVNNDRTRQKYMKLLMSDIRSGSL